MSKPLGIRAYGSIPHISRSRLGSGDHHIEKGQERILFERPRPHDLIVAQEKIDGVNMAVAKLKGEIIPLNRAGYRAASSPYETQILFHHWVKRYEATFDQLLQEGERIVGEWIARAIGTVWPRPMDEAPFWPFDIFTPENERLPYQGFYERMEPHLEHLPARVPFTLSYTEPTPPEELIPIFFENSELGEKAEGIVWRAENREKVDFLAKWVRPDKVDGAHFEEFTWNVSEAFVKGLREN